ncbi:YdcF family protein [Pontiella sp.]|uniref:YdcF family protein n=1 Tax=Pontiella sp. TaxID=2837462 RepID=UPI00356652DC
MFWIRKILARAVFPLPLVFELVLVGGLLLRFRRTRKFGIGLMVAGLLVLGICSQPSVGNGLLYSLERRHHALDVAALDAGTNYVVAVAGNGFRVCGPHCVGCFNDPFLIRLQEAGRIANALAKRGIEYRLVVSANSEAVAVAKRTALNDYFAAFGIPSQNVALVEGAANSRLEVENFVRHSGKLVLVSNAYHLPRLMKLAGLHRADALAAPAGWQASPAKFALGIPSADALAATRTYVYERLGMLFP